MLIRNATPADATGIAVAHRASIESLCSGSYSAEQIAGWVTNLVPDIYESAIREKVMIVAEDEGDIVGLGILDVDRREIGAVYVHPTVKGRGVGARVLAELEARAAASQVEQLTLCATVNALGFYRRHGYVPDGETSHELPNGVTLECVRMHKALSC